MQKLIPAILILSLVLSACKSTPTGPSQKSYDSLKTELNNCIAENNELQNTPSIQLGNAKKLYASGREQEALTAFKSIVDRFPNTDEAVFAEKKSNEIEKAIEEKAEYEARKKALGYKVLKAHTQVEVGDINLKFSRVLLSNQWTFDSYGDTYHYQNAERDQKLVVATVSVSSKSKDPKLAPIGIYALEDGQLKKLDIMEYRFARWKDYGSYLGNYSDYNNDFAHTKTIRFKCGVSINEKYTDKPLFVVVKKVNDLSRSTDRFDNPPVSYSSYSIELAESLTVNDFDSEYVLIQIFNRNKL